MLKSITLDRVDGDVTFTRGEYVKAWLSVDQWVFGYITGLREHGAIVVVDDLEYERGRIYKTEPPPAPKTQPQASLSRIIASVNRKHDFEFTDTDRVK